MGLKRDRKSIALACGLAEESNMGRIDRLIAEMTLAEKIGQMTMTASDYAVTGPVITKVSEDSIRAGAIGNLLNLYGPEAVHRMQKIAVEESRLGIPLLLGYDVIHGHHTVFPIPLAEAGQAHEESGEEPKRPDARGGREE